MSTSMDNLSLQSLPPEIVFVTFSGGLLVLAAWVVASFVYRTFIANARPTYKGFPMVGMDEKAKTPWQLRVKFLHHGKELVWDNVAKLNMPFQLETTTGPTIILPPRYMDEVRNDDRMTFAKALQEDFFTTYPGFEGFRPASHDNIFTTSVRKGLNQSINRVTEIVSREVDALREQMWPVNDEWTTTTFASDARWLIARLSARTFVPEPLCHSQEWLDLNINYPVNYFTGTFMMRMVPDLFRPVVHWFLPVCRQLRRDVAAAARILKPEVERRRRARAQGTADSGNPKDSPDAFQWMENTANERIDTYNYIHGQLAYTLGAVHTTSGTFVHVVYDLVNHPEYIGDLREEIASVWKPGETITKNTLQKLKLLDSFMKESQRTNPVAWMTTHRKVHKDITLSDGTVLPTGAMVGIPLCDLWNEEKWENPMEFDGHRFYKMRQQLGEETKHQFVSTSNEMINFGHGKYACPGRFFAANEIKIGLVNMLMYYDIRALPGGAAPLALEHGIVRSPNPEWKIQYRCRQT
ncbi:uncharacterized protein A1O5_09403 [Cladophialophora psammophila CBS 110553]|uniref:Cytochrome P450 oxidoreductase n=1 Tax=Cladophialophora psammophila CBS 110553 TaxID=1182543 RepID=W9WQZ6_9EURO|nr:uncharacterized protein A1O5_09403 [Cladophialophora psammophila CBS 110553]EXJ67390.1 hypothetical protein A1O5_09403 [Cladophialophora psammophila CBS 110553]